MRPGDRQSPGFVLFATRRPIEAAPRQPVGERIKLLVVAPDAPFKRGEQAARLRAKLAEPRRDSRRRRPTRGKFLEPLGDPAHLARKTPRQRRSLDMARVDQLGRKMPVLDRQMDPHQPTS